MGANTSLATLYAWARRGKRARTKVPRNRGPNTTLLASMTHEGMGPCVAVVGSNHWRGLRGINRAGALDGAQAWPGRGHGQPVGAQGEHDTRAGRGTGLRAVVLAALLAGPEPDRGSVRQGEGPAAT